MTKVASSKEIVKGGFFGVRISTKISCAGPVVLCHSTRKSRISPYGSESDCRCRGREFDPGPVPYFRGDSL